MGKRLNNLTSTIICYFPVGTSADPEFVINLSKIPFLLKNEIEKHQAYMSYVKVNL